jgi:peptide/nickel transport system permease protein
MVSVLALLSASFLMIHLIPGDPVRAALGPVAAQSVVDAQRESLGLNDPLWLQYLHFLQHLFTGNFGTSITTGLPVSDVIRDRLPATVQLAVAAFLVAVLIALPLGLAMGVLTRAGRRPKTELTFTSTSVVLAAIPEFLLAVGLVYVFAVQLHWFPVAGRGNVSSYVLPVLSLAVGPAAVLARICRVELLAVLQTDYLRTARAKRLPAIAICATRFPTRSQPRSPWAVCCSAEWSPGPCWSRTSSAGPGSAARSSRRSSPRTTRSCRASCSCTASACCW